jgi:hypothetical protein
MLLLVAAAFIRFAIAPYGDELIAGEAALPGVWVDAFQSKHPFWGVLFSALTVASIATTLGRATSAFGLYKTRTTITIPLYAIVACGIFIASDSLAVVVSVYFVGQMMRYLCGVYVRGTDLNYAFYAGICAALSPLFYAPVLPILLLVPIAMAMFGLSWREIVVMVAGLLLPLSTLCYVGWLCGDEFISPATAFADAVIAPSHYTLWASESVVALMQMGVLLFLVCCGVVSFWGDTHSVAVRPRTIIVFYIISFIISCTAFAMPSATAGLLMLVALPAAVLMPIVLLRLGDRISNLVVIALVLLMILHLFIA